MYNFHLRSIKLFISFIVSIHHLNIAISWKHRLIIFLHRCNSLNASAFDFYLTHNMLCVQVTPSPFPPVERYLYISGCRDRVIGIHISFLCTVSRSLPYRLPERGQVDVRTFGQRQRWQTLSFRVVRAGTRSKRAVSETVPRRLRHGQVRWLPATRNVIPFTYIST